MEVPKTAFKYRCQCPENYTGTFAQLRGHRAHRKYPECQVEPTVEIDDTVAIEALETPLERMGLKLVNADDIQARSSDDEDEGEYYTEQPVGNGVHIKSPSGPVGSRVYTRDQTREAQSKGVKGQFAKPVGPSLFNDKGPYETSLYATWDAFRNNFGYDRTFNEWARDIIFDWLDLMGYELILHIRPATLDKTEKVEVSFTDRLSEKEPATAGSS